jgi:glutamine amidotransferase
MARVVGYICSDDTLTHAVLEEVADELKVTNASEDVEVGRGVGWVQEGRSLLRKRPPQSRGSQSFAHLMTDIPSREFVAYEDRFEQGRVEPPDLQPFGFRTWVYAQTQAQPSLLEDEARCVDAIPDHIRRNIGGDTSQEIACHVFLAALSDAGGFGLSESSPKRCARALADSIYRTEAVSEGAERPGSVVTISERILIGARTEEPLWIRTFHGIETTDDDPLFAGHRPSQDSYPQFRAAIIASADEPPSEEWEPIPERSILWVDSSWERHVEPIEALRTDSV